MKLIINIFILLQLAALLFSCGSTRELQMMQGTFDTANLSKISIPTTVIQKGDLLSIIVYSDNPAATAIYNQSIAGGNTSSSITGVTSGVASMPPTSPGYLVDEEGDIQFQGIGKLRVDGLNKTQLTELLNSKLTKFLTNPYYNIRFLNYKITVIGDVSKPGMYSIPSERVNLLEALGLAGDLNVTARRDNVKIIREKNGKRVFGSIDLRKSDIFLSDFYQLQQNDVIYVDLSKNKAAMNDQLAVRNIGLVTGVISTIAFLITVFRR
jgi:polysaccharide biosynthesis/export protein